MSTSSATDDNVYCIVLVLRVPVLLLPLLTIQIVDNNLGQSSGGENEPIIINTVTGSASKRNLENTEHSGLANIICLETGKLGQTCKTKMTEDKLIEGFCECGK